MTGLVGWWPLHENSGDAARDLSGNGNHGSLNGGVTQGVAGKGGLTAYSFDGSDGYVSLPSSVADGSEFSVSVWIRPTAQTSNGVIVGLQDGRAVRTYLTDNSTTVETLFYDSNGSNYYATASDSVSLYEWYHVMFSWNGSKLRIYVDGTLKDSVSISSQDSFNEGNSIGRNDFGGGKHYIPANISGVRVYDRALLPQEIQTLYEWGGGDYTDRSYHDGSDSGAVSRWELNNSSDNSTATDSWDSNDGTIDGASYVSDGVRGSSLQFNGSSDNVKNIPIDIKNWTELTFSVWAKVNSYQSRDDAIIGQHDSDGQDAVQILAKDTGGERAVSFRVKHDGSWTSNTPHKSYPTSMWGHHVGVYTGSEIIYYRNGRFMSSESYNKDFSQNDGEFRLATWQPYTDNFFNGNISETRVYDRALEPHEVFQLYQWGTRGRDMRKLTVNQR
jgi:hypothetical protein